MCYCEDSHQVVTVRSVDEAVGIAPEDIPSCVDFEARPTEGCGSDLLDGVVQVREKALFRTEAPLPVPVSGLLDLMGGLWMEDQPATGHGDRA